jgi:hypothetical protein
MLPSVQAFLSGVVDYAGLFPPAQLPMEQAIRNYARYRQEPDSWMLGRFVCPAALLAQLAPYQDELFDPAPPFVFSALGRGGQEVSDFLTGLRADLEAIAQFRDRHGGAVTVDVLELRLPADVQRSHELDALRALLGAVADLIEPLGPPSLTPYYEMAAGPEWPTALSAVRHILASDHRSASRHRQRCRPGGVKVRCGGLEASAFPSPEQVAFALTACRDAAVPFKATAGLHHPLRRFDRRVKATMHGFLNVFGAGVLAHARGLSEDEVTRILADKTANHFVFDDARFSWNDIHATIAEISAARHEGVISFGSCSFDEPRDDLRALGLLP